MASRRNTFARVTDEHDLLSVELTPCAGYLYRLLLRTAPAGKTQEFELKEEFCQVWDYSLKWAKAALRELINRDLVEVLREFSGHGYRLIAWHPSQKTSPTSLETSSIDPKTSRSQPSNPDSLAPLYREIRETTDKPTHHPVSTNEQEGGIDTPTTPKSPEPEMVSDRPQVNEPQVIQKIEEAGFKLNSTLITIARTTTAQIVLQAIEAAQQYHHRLQQQNKPLRRQPEALLVTAIRQQWQVNSSGSEAQTMPPEFDEWYQLARSVDVVQASSIQADVTRHQPGVLCVLTPSGNWEPFELMRVVYSVKKLRSMVAEREEWLRLAIGCVLS
jgi:hypothetical protein